MLFVDIAGDTIEVVHSDAEGRMLLADVLALASRKTLKPSKIHNPQQQLSPKLLIDFATLTSTTINALTSRYIGAFSIQGGRINQSLQQTVMNAGKTSGERVWPFPCDSDYDEDLKSDVADILQCRQPTEADHIYATAFLKRFVSPATPWVHFDIGSVHRY